MEDAMEQAETKAQNPGHDPRQNRLFVNAYGLTDPGKVREANQDHFLIAALHRNLDVVQTSLDAVQCQPVGVSSQSWVLMVADGMGGHAGGEEASAMAVEHGLRYLRNTMPWFMRTGEEQPEVEEEALRSIVSRCNEDVLALAEDKAPRKSRMGTTLTLAYVLWPDLFVVHAGDSRCYLVRQEGLQQVTDDHTVAQQLVEHDVLEPEEAEESRYAHVLTQVVGGGQGENLEADVHHLRLQDGDTLLLCTDGLTDMLSDEKILELMEQGGLADERCRTLIEAANQAGGSDNITAVVASFEQRHV
jgi:protein phosphatase